jgi:hypothetical protein
MISVDVSRLGTFLVITQNPLNGDQNISGCPRVINFLGDLRLYEFLNAIIGFIF